MRTHQASCPACAGRFVCFSEWCLRSSWWRYFRRDELAGTGTCTSRRQLKERRQETWVPAPVARRLCWLLGCGEPQHHRRSPCRAILSPDLLICDAARHDDDVATGRGWGYFHVPNRTISYVQAGGNRPMIVNTIEPHSCVQRKRFHSHDQALAPSVYEAARLPPRTNWGRSFASNAVSERRAGPCQT